MKKWLLALILLFGFFNVSLASGAEIVGRGQVIDGDSIVISGLRIRLHGIDAPEIKQVCKRGGSTYLCGEIAARALTNPIFPR